MTIVWIILSNVIIIALVAWGYVTYNLLIKNEKLEETVIKQQDYINSLSQIINVSSEKLKEIDTKGMFQSDDEVGFFFEGLKEIQKILNEFNLHI